MRTINLPDKSEERSACFMIALPNELTLGDQYEAEILQLLEEEHHLPCSKQPKLGIECSQPSCSSQLLYHIVRHSSSDWRYSSSALVLEDASTGAAVEHSLAESQRTAHHIETGLPLFK